MGEGKPVVRLALATNASSQAVTSQLGALLLKLVPGEICEQSFSVPNTPYVVDFAVAARRLLIVVPRPNHRSLAEQRLSCQGKLMETVLHSMDWQVRWLWPEEWAEGSTEGSNEETLRILLGLDGT